jgi:hypothetical protein
MNYMLENQCLFRIHGFLDHKNILWLHILILQNIMNNKLVKFQILDGKIYLFNITTTEILERESSSFDYNIFN